MWKLAVIMHIDLNNVNLIKYVESFVVLSGIKKVSAADGQKFRGRETSPSN